MSQSTEKPRRPAPQLADFPHRANEIVRYGDLDPQGHVNNAVFLTYFESGRVAMFRARDLGIGVANATFALARQETDFLRELHWQDKLVIGTAVLAFGRTSFTVAQAIFRGEECAATGRAVMVTLDATTRKPRPLPPEIVSQLEPWRYRGSDR
jgi:acyl-CoA thioester hydrolase